MSRQVLVTDLTMDTGVQELLVKAELENIETAFQRAKEQEPHCKFGLTGVCCRRCLQGPCRVTFNGNKGVKRGVCGATADQIVARNLLSLIVEGTTPHVEHAREILHTLLETAEGKAPYEIKGKEKLISIGKKLGLTVDGVELDKLAKEVALIALQDFQQQSGVSNWLRLRAQDQSIETWKKLNILPSNAHLEIANAINKTAMGCESDPVSLLLGIMKMGLVEGYDGLHLSTDLQDILFGTPRLVKTQYRMGVIKEEYVNIAVHGHIPMVSEKVLEWSRKLNNEAKALGAKGINIVGICCSANELLMRQGVSVATNYASQELAIITGALEAMVVDAQCIMPGLAQVAECYHTELISALPNIKIEGASHVDWTPEDADKMGEEIVRRALAHYPERDQSKVQIPAGTVEAYAGFSVEQIVELLATLNGQDPLLPLIEAIATGDILGVVAIVGCTNPKVKQDWANTEVAKELMRNNVLIVASGCSAHSLGKNGLLSPNGLQYCGEKLANVLTAIGQANGLPALPPALHMGSCVDNSRIDDLLVALGDRMGVAVRELPVAGSSPENHSPKALSIGTFFIAQGVDVHIGVNAPITGSPLVEQALTANKGEFPVTTDELFGGKLIYEADPIQAAQTMIGRIIQKRKALGLVCPETTESAKK
ncbi:anaerobic carbon-monoxide dehydrogenase catalytic subunit [Desulfosporosinus nitroreducens]|uniref:anaerobic carbon-monoxide dehydrogenase catalytic subunit n=1 Tax=Desulfosporosinus nitroreducens TaxID=2018668 RepID=UPI00207C9B65|nr:anaerobic carbon-monoxide dehydrogenase catalytic subunit [Desulfosporosinus nitroreducens]MCO1603366.1 anaerobic carbon-monoxide dehydrogenase catalytic subunit [Desulfosporosinus nitroreducens]